jgi:hypothetical protein
MTVRAGCHTDALSGCGSALHLPRKTVGYGRSLDGQGMNARGVGSAYAGSTREPAPHRRSPVARPNTAPTSARSLGCRAHLAWLHHFKRLLVRYDRRAEIDEAFVALGCLARLLHKALTVILIDF